LANEYELEIDVVRVQDVGLIGTSDPFILEWAAANHRVVLTHDSADHAVVRLGSDGERIAHVRCGSSATGSIPR